MTPALELVADLLLILGGGVIGACVLWLWGRRRDRRGSGGAPWH